MHIAAALLAQPNRRQENPYQLLGQGMLTIKPYINGIGKHSLHTHTEQLAIYLASVIMGTLALKNGFYAHTHD